MTPPTPPPWPARITITASASVPTPNETSAAARLPVALPRVALIGACRAISPPAAAVITIATLRSIAADPRASRRRRYSSNRRSTAQRLSSWRFESCSLRSTALTWASTVRAEIPSCWAISLYM